MRTTLSIVAGLITVGALCTAAGDSEPFGEERFAHSSGRNDCFELVEKVAFTSTRDSTGGAAQNAAEIYLMNPDGSGAQRITANDIGDAFPVLSPDGKKIVFDSNRLPPAEPLNMTDLFVMASDGTEQTLVTRGSSASWAPDSKHITFHASASGTQLPIRPDPGAPPRDSDIFIVNVDDSAAALQLPINITNSVELIEDDPHWSPDGQKIVYSAHSVNDDPVTMPFIYPTAELFVVNADGSGTPVQLTFNKEEERAPAWSPDGTKIAFMCRYGGTDFEICVVNANGSGLVQVTNNTIQELSIRWSVDGQKFYFNSPLSGRNQLYSINADGTGFTQLTDTPGLNLFPAPGLLRVRTECEPDNAQGARDQRRTAAKRFRSRRSAI